VAKLGAIILIGTPIGNLGDMTLRAVDGLRSLDVLFCEDTRVSGPLLAHFGLNVSLRALSDDLPQARVDEAVALALSGKRVGFVSDAGMPGVSDPARRLTRGAWSAGIAPQVIPGVSALATLLAVCPFVDGPFTFAGFAPRKNGEVAQFVKTLAVSFAPTMFFCGRSRIHSLLDELCASVEPSRQVLLGREMTKLYETYTLLEAGRWSEMRESIPAKGEFTVAIARAPLVETPLDEQAARSALERLETAGFSTRDSIKALAAVWDRSPNEVKKLRYK
jgi:16S rRNA (cytidine1402-2'-O)-methyltransferase